MTAIEVMKDGPHRAIVELLRINGDLCIKVNGGLLPTRYMRIEQGGPGEAPVVCIEFYPTDFENLPDAGEQ